jgi:hypothetical protein
MNCQIKSLQTLRMVQIWCQYARVEHATMQKTRAKGKNKWAMNRHTACFVVLEDVWHGKHLPLHRERLNPLQFGNQIKNLSNLYQFSVWNAESKRIHEINTQTTPVLRLFDMCTAVKKTESITILKPYQRLVQIWCQLVSGFRVEQLGGTQKQESKCDKHTQTACFEAVWLHAKT